jgi:hypothetical protein
MCIKNYETEIGGEDPVRALELLEKKETMVERVNDVIVTQVI